MLGWLAPLLIHKLYQTTIRYSFYEINGFFGGGSLIPELTQSYYADIYWLDCPPFPVVVTGIIACFVGDTFSLADYNWKGGQPNLLAWSDDIFHCSLLLNGLRPATTNTIHTQNQQRTTDKQQLTTQATEFNVLFMNQS